jgi:hypothetical protein
LRGAARSAQGKKEQYSNTKDIGEKSKVESEVGIEKGNKM